MYLCHKKFNISNLVKWRIDYQVFKPEWIGMLCKYKPETFCVKISLFHFSDVFLNINDSISYSVISEILSPFSIQNFLTDCSLFILSLQTIF